MGEEGIEEGERDPMRWVRRCCEFLLDSLRSRVGLARLVLEVIWRSSVGERVDIVVGGWSKDLW